MSGARSIAPHLVALALGSAWIGAVTIVSVVVAPAAFAALPSRALAGALVGRVLPALFWSGIVIGLGSAALAWASPARAARLGAGFTVVVACAVAQLVVSPRIARLREAIGGPMEALGAADPRRLEFGRLHGLSVALLGVAAVAAAVGLLLVLRSLPPVRDA